MDFDQLTQNMFDLSKESTGFVDHYSHLVVTVPQDRIGLARLSPRGLANVRDPLADPAFYLWVQSETEERPQAVRVYETGMFPWGCQQRGRVSLAGCWIEVLATLLALEHNVYLWNVELKPEHPMNSELSLVLTGAFAQKFTEQHAEIRDGKAVFGIRQVDERSDTFFNTQPDLMPCWRLSLVDKPLTLQCQGVNYRLEAPSQQLETVLTLRWVLEGENCPPFLWRHWPVERQAVREYNVDILWEAAKQRWEKLLNPSPNRERASFSREVRASAVLDRCGYRGKHGQWNPYVASVCSIASWASSAFFWDVGVGALGLSEYNCARAEDALRVLFVYQRPDGCVPTHSYEHMVGSTFYPQAPILSWVVWHMVQKHGNWDFVREMLPRMRALFEWNARTQDQDSDGLIEVRYTGQVADNAPHYRRYIQYVPGHGDIWNIFLPPVASVALNSFHYADACFQARLYRGLGQPEEAKAVLARVAHIPQALNQTCWDEESSSYQDFDHQIGVFNRASVLTHFLPIWAGMPLPAARIQMLIEHHLLNPTRFYGLYPFPYLAYDDPAYTSQGYWSGRVWPHTTLWMLELLWEHGYRAEADQAASRLLAMMDQREEFLENYYSQPETPGGGHPDFLWSAASYLFIVNRGYRRSEKWTDSLNSRTGTSTI